MNRRRPPLAPRIGRFKRPAASRLAASTLVLGVWLSAETQAHAQAPPILFDGMDGPAPAFKVLETHDQIAGKILAQVIERGGESNSGVERISYAALPGTSLPAGYSLPAAPVIEELRLTAVVMCNRPGARLAALVVLPQTKTETGKPLEMLVRADATIPARQWQTLTLADLPRLVEQNVRVVRAKARTPVDPRGAFVTKLVILAPGGPGSAELWIDEVALYGVLATTDPSTAGLADSQPGADASSLPVAHAEPTPMPPAPKTPRMIEWQGEQFALLKGVGFDGVWMRRLPTDTELAEARRTGLFLVCPPPPPEALPGTALDARFDPVLAWDLGEIADAAELEAMAAWRTAVLRSESRPDRPTIARSRELPHETSRICDVLAVGRPTAGASITAPEYAAWLGQQRRMVRPGTSVWVEIDADCGDRARMQLASIRGDAGFVPPATLDELTRATTAALAIQPRGFLFRSRTSLAKADAATRTKLLALQLTNIRLGLAEPWLAAGKAATIARDARGGPAALDLRVERTHLIVPLAAEDETASAVGSGSTPGGVTFVLPGTPETSEAYLLTVAGPMQLAKRRVTGGLRITADRLPSDAFLVVTEDGRALSHVERYIERNAQRGAEARVQLAVLERQYAAAVAASAPAEWLAEAEATAALTRADLRLAAVAEASVRRDVLEAFRQAELASDELDRLLVRLESAAADELPPGTSPVPLNWTTVAEFGRALLLATAANQSNDDWIELPGGQFEDLASTLASGWQQFERPTAGVQSAVRLSPVEPAAGAACLELEARATGDALSPPLIATPPVWVTSPPLFVPAGCLIDVTGLVRITDEAPASADPLIIFDSIGGEEHGVRLASAPVWTPFRLVRAAPPGTPCRVTIALGACGRAQIDSLRYRFIPIAAGLEVARRQSVTR